MKRLLIILIFAINTLSFLTAAEFNEGSIRLVLNENTGRFSLYANSNSRYTPLFTADDPRTSFMTVSINDRFYKLGDTTTFGTRIISDPVHPSFVFESSLAVIIQEFSFIKTANSDSTNAVELKITIENRSRQGNNIGFRLLLDTYLGEPGALPHFSTVQRIINSETLINRGGTENYWVSANNNLSFMGSIDPLSGEGPDSIHFANWKRLSDVSWKIPFENGRNFNAPPYSIGDSAVCYYYEPRTLAMGEKFTVTILLGIGDEGFTQTIADSAPVTPIVAVPAPVVPVPEPPSTPEPEPDPAPSNLPAVPAIQMEWDLAVLHDLLFQIDEFIINDSITEDDLKAMEEILNQLRNKYGIDPGSPR